MARIELLNNVDHKDLRVITERSAKYGDNVWYVPTFPAEFRNVQRCYPIYFTKMPETGRFQAVAVFGFEERENLFLDENGWNAPYVPLSVVRQPFLIGRQESGDETGPGTQLVLSVDRDNPRCSTTEGEPLFLEHGGSSAYLEQVTEILQMIYAGYENSAGFADMLLGMDLLESFVLDVELDDGSNHRLTGFYTIKEESLQELSGSDLALLRNNGYLEAIYMVIASMSHIPDLLQLKNRLVANNASDAAD
jgi:hypothetical protein